MIYILHISDLHFLNNDASFKTSEILLQEAAEKVKEIPQGKKLLIVTGDLHNYRDNDYQKAADFLQKLVSQMKLDMKQDVFVIPGSNDVGNDTVLDPLLKAKDKHWKSHQKSCLAMLKNGDTSYIEERLQRFLPYCAFVQRLGIYNTTSGDTYPAASHVRRWRDKLNILHLNTALIADETQGDTQMTDADAAAAPATWKSCYDDKIPAIAIGHSNFFDLKKDQREVLAKTFTRRNVSAYLCCGLHQAEPSPEDHPVHLQPESNESHQIPNLAAARNTADADNGHSEVGFCWHYWDEASDKVNVEFRKWTRNSRGKTELNEKERQYAMRHEKSDELDRIPHPAPPNAPTAGDHGSSKTQSAFPNEGHAKKVTCLAVLKNGSIVSGSEDQKLLVWDPSTGECLQTLSGHSHTVNCVVALEGNKIASGSDDCTVRVWDLTTGECVQTMQGGPNSVRLLAALPNGKVVSGSYDTLFVWDPSSGERLQTLKHIRPVLCITVLPDGKIISGSEDKTVRVWNSDTGECIKVLEKPKKGMFK